ncbi:MULTISPECIES: SDR family oxidoreductase [Ramlibacter]|uniref:SDR family oxidoreductase n=1 Tax=Ramlibacter aquaticus TaxID=2780094 RepID=A0ABR9SIW0_9BURK|nr:MULTISPECIES: SDR family oxidoreductase [Ramlibacter]MBE7942301.1 SDR family oxidoreductase [Ramlibacter aquaticus]
MTRTEPTSARVAIVTGGARGIGLAIARWFLARGQRVALLDIDGETLDRAVAALAQPGQVLGLHCDVGQPQQVEAAARAVMQRFGRVDALVNNAGVAVFKPVLDTSFEEWRHVMATNLDGAFLCTQVFAPLMVHGGAVVNIASISGLRASTLRIAYGTSKAALLHMTRQHAVELGNVGIRVNAVCPGPVETEMARQVHSPAIRADYHDAIPQGRYGTPEEIANAVGFLCSEEASYVNGQFLAVDGGFDAAGVGLPTLRRNAAAGGAQQ